MLVAPPALAQGGSYGVVSGIAIDSLRGGVLARAQIAVEGTDRVAMTRSDGSFVIDSVPTGEHRLRLLHPVLDTIGLRVVTPALAVRAGDTTEYTVSMPGAGTIVRAKCRTQVSSAAPAALFGIVVDAAGAPVGGAQVVLSWVDLQISREGVRRIPQQRLAATGEDGHFRLCLLPPEISGELVARDGPDAVGPVPVVFGEALMATRAFVISGGARASVRGTVRNVNGAPVSSARVTLFGGTSAAITDTSGRFTLDGQPAGTRTLLVRRIGYQPVEIPVDLTSIATEEVAVTMHAYVPVLAPVLVQRRMEATLERVGFRARRQTGLGRYLGPEDIDRIRPIDMVDLLRRLSPLRVVHTEFGGRIIVGRPGGFEADGCVNYFIDNQPWMGEGSPVDFMQPNEIGAVEVYAAAYTPAEYVRPLQNCDTVVLWTRYRLDRTS